MIRIILDPGPQKGRDVLRWVHEASGYKRSKIYAIAKDMPDLTRGVWMLDKSPHEHLVRERRLHAVLTEAVIKQRGEYDDEQEAA